MRILPVYPEFPPSFWSFRYAVRMLGKKASMPPLGLITVAAMIPEDRFDVQRIVDLNTEKLTDRQLQDTDMVFASAMLVQKDSLDEIIDRAHFFGKRVAVGGPFPTSYSDQVKADHLILGEAEVTLPAFLEDLLNGNARRVYDTESVISRISGIELTRELRPMLDSTPIPRWDLIDINNYPSLAIQYSRGCPFDCEFCDITHLYGRIPRTKSPAQMEREFDAVYKRGWRGALFIVDDNFIGNKKNVRELLPVTTRWQRKHNFPFSFYTEASTDLALPNNRDILEGMVEAGFNQVFLGIESIDPEVLKDMNKRQNLKQSPYDQVRIIQEAGLEVTGGFIVGSDKDKPDVFDKLFDFIQKTGIVIPMPGLLGALKGTKLYNRLEEEGRLRGTGSGNNTHALEFNFDPKLDEKFLLKGYTELLRKLFDSKNYYDRCRVLYSRFGKHKAQKRVNASGIRAFFNAMYENLIARPDREFVKYAHETLVKNPRQFPEVIASAVKLHHFKTITDATISLSNYRTKVDELYDSLESSAGNLRGSAEEKCRQFSSLAVDIERNAVKMHRDIHRDFRHNVKDYLTDLRSRINELRTNQGL